jgi:hypothetical protein
MHICWPGIENLGLMIRGIYCIPCKCVKCTLCRQAVLLRQGARTIDGHICLHQLDKWAMAGQRTGPVDCNNFKGTMEPSCQHIQIKYTNKNNSGKKKWHQALLTDYMTDFLSPPTIFLMVCSEIRTSTPGSERYHYKYNRSSCHSTYQPR